MSAKIVEPVCPTRLSHAKPFGNGLGNIIYFQYIYLKINLIIYKMIEFKVYPTFFSMWIEIGKRDQIQDASSENDVAYCFVCDRIRGDDAMQ